MTDRRSILLLCWIERNEAGNVAPNVAALTRMSRHDVRPFNPVDRPDAAALLDLNEFDVVVIHYTIAVTIERSWTHYIPLEKDFSNIAEVAERIRDLPFLVELDSTTRGDVCC
jgi:hypothetical protein